MNMVVLPNLCVRCGTSLSYKTDKRDFLLISGGLKEKERLTPKKVLCVKCITQDNQKKFLFSLVMLFLVVLSFLFSSFYIGLFQDPSNNMGQGRVKFLLSLMGGIVVILIELKVLRKTPVGKYFKYKVLRTEKGYFYFENRKYAHQFLLDNKKSIKYKELGKKTNKILYEKKI